MTNKKIDEEQVSQMISYLDEEGQEVSLPREEWKRKVLVKLLQQSWSDSDELYEVIITALEYGFFKAITKAVVRLFDIDENKERAYTVKSIVCMKNNMWADAKSVLEEYIDSYGTTPIILTNLAKIFYQEESIDLAEATLWAALTKDPNQESALELWAAIRDLIDEDEEDGYKKALEQIADIKGSWRAQLMLASSALEEDAVDDAINLFKEAMSKSFADQEVLYQVSSSLIKIRLFDEIFDMIVPIYNPQKHGPYTGLNILQAYIDTENHDLGMALFQRLHAVFGPEIQEYLDYFLTKLNKLES
jgi:tetratricopeptide (TPR) repeat protein